jgi:hypothetical protein
MVNYTYAKPYLQKSNKKAFDFINFLFDNRRKRRLEKLKGQNSVYFERNGGGGSEIYINYDIKEDFFEFLKE